MDKNINTISVLAEDLNGRYSSYNPNGYEKMRAFVKDSGYGEFGAYMLINPSGHLLISPSPGMAYFATLHSTREDHIKFTESLLKMESLSLADKISLMIMSDKMLETCHFDEPLSKEDLVKEGLEQLLVKNSITLGRTTIIITHDEFLPIVEKFFDEYTVPYNILAGSDR